MWASLLGWLVLGERLNRNALAGLALCLAELAVLVYPVLGSHALIGLSLSPACAITWAIATIYIKLVRLPSGLAITTWQIFFAAVVDDRRVSDLPGLADVRACVGGARRWP